MKLLDTLDNGATVIGINGQKVLAIFGGVQPYVVWMISDTGDAYWGKYFSNLEDASKHLNKGAFD